MPAAEPLLPQLSTRSNAIITSVDWLFEPAWRGERLIGRFEDGAARVFDRIGEPVGLELEEVADVLAMSIDADQAVIDGIWTAQPFVGAGSAAQHLAEAREEAGLAAELPDPIETETRRAFVAVDLLELDGVELLDVPYQERRRLLESVIDENVRVRITPAVRVPLQHWLAAWQASGFTHYVAKEANSRYLPGEMNADWLEITLEPDRGPSMTSRLFGFRGPKKARIEDRGR
jgi:bifunctional non-homologous end joining protein LigD